MQKQKQALIALFPRLLLAAIFCCSPLSAAAEPADGGDAAISRDMANTILKELREIRQVLERIEKQGGRAAQRPSKPAIARVSIQGKHVMGAEDAPVTVVEFADYQCPFCLRFIKTSFPILKEKYIDTGKVRWVALDLPLPFHKDARKAAQAAHCAGDQDKYWEMRGVLFKNPLKLNPESLAAYAAFLALDMDAFNACLQSDRHLDEIDQDAKDANAVRLTGTPSFIIGKSASNEISGRVVIGAQPMNVFDSVISNALKQASTGQEIPGH